MFDIRKIQEQVVFGAAAAAGGEEKASQVVYGEAGQASREEDAAWVKNAMGRLERLFNKDAVRQIRMNCQCGYGMDEKLAFLKRLMKSSSCMEEFAAQKEAKAAGLFCRDAELYLQFLFCPCPMLAQVEKLDTDAWCQCTTGYSKALFEKAFGCEVDVRLLKSIKIGDDVCLQKIIPLGPVAWE